MRRSTFSKNQKGVAEFDAIAVENGVRACQQFAVELGAAFGIAIVQQVTVGRRFDLGVKAGDIGIAEKADFNMLIKADPRLPVDKQINMSFLTTAEDLNPGRGGGLFDEARQSPSPRRG